MESFQYTQKEFYLLIKKNLRRIHYNSGYSRAQVAEGIDISFQAYSDMLTLSLIERYPSLETMRRFCLFFHVEIIEFFKPINESILQNN